MRRWHTADVVADRAGFVDNEPSFMNGSPVTKPGRLRPCLILFLMLPMLLPLIPERYNNTSYWMPPHRYFCRARYKCSFLF